MESRKPLSGGSFEDQVSGRAARPRPGLPPVPRCQPPPTGWPTNGPKNRTSTQKTPIGRTVRPTSERLPRAGAEPGPLCGISASPEEATGPRHLSGTKWNPESHLKDGVFDDRVSGRPNADDRGCRRCPAASRPRRDGPPVGRKTAHRPKKHLSDGQFGPLVGGCPGRALDPGRCAVFRLARKQPPERDIMLVRNGSLKTTCRRGCRRPGLGPGCTPTAGAAAAAPLPSATLVLAHQWAEKPHIDPKSTYRPDRSAHQWAVAPGGGHVPSSGVNWIPACRSV